MKGEPRGYQIDIRDSNALGKIILILVSFLFSRFPTQSKNEFKAVVNFYS